MRTYHVGSQRTCKTGTFYFGESRNFLFWSDIREGAVLYLEDRKPFVEVPDAAAENGRRRIAVSLGISNGVHTEVLSGLREEQQVILQ